MNYSFSLKSLVIILSLCISLPAVAQHFGWESTVSDIKTNGFYKIQLNPEIPAKLNSDFGDIRIYDNEGKEVPYIFESEKTIEYNDYFIEYKIIEKKEQTSWPYYTRLVLHNPSKNKISNIQLIIRNSDVSKNLKLSGSDDNKNWYIIKDSYRFQAMYSDTETSVIKIIDFPVSDYEYYEILIDDWKNNPVNVLRAGFYNTSVEKGKYSLIEKPVISQLELKEEKQSLVKISFQDLQLINKLTFKIEGPEYYFRNAEIQVRDSTKNKRNEFEYFFKTIDNIVISSNSNNTFYFNSFRAKDIFIRIINHDNEPIVIKSVTGEQLNHYLVCKLETSKKYQIQFGDQQLLPPEYDIKYFSDKIPENIPITKTGKVLEIGKKQNEKVTGINLNSSFIWIAIILVVILLLYMVYRMLNEMKKNKD
jgi:hypothetical protein